MPCVRIVRRGLALGATAVIVAAGGAPAPATAAAPWRIAPASPARSVFLLGVAALPQRQTAVLLQELRGGERRLVLRRSGRPARTLAVSRHTFAGALGADARGRLVVVWQVAGDVPAARIWIAGRTRVLSPTGRPAPQLDVAPDGGVAVGVSAPRAPGASAAVYRGSTRTGVGERTAVSGLATLDAVFVGAGGRVVVAGSLPAAGGKFLPAAFSWAAGPTAPFAPPSSLAPAPGPAGQDAWIRRVAVGVTPGGAAMAATNSLHCTPGGGDLGGECAPPITGTIQVTTWPAGAPAAGTPVTVSAGSSTTDPVFVRSGERAWAAWLEGATRPDRVAAVPVTSAGAGRTVRRSLPPSSIRSPVLDRPAIAASGSGGLRAFVLTRSGGATTLSTTVLGRSGRFGPWAPITRDVSFGLTQLQLPATGAPADLVGWTTSTASGRGSRAWVAWPADRPRIAP